MNFVPINRFVHLSIGEDSEECLASVRRDVSTGNWDPAIDDEASGRSSGSLWAAAYDVVAEHAEFPWRPSLDFLGSLARVLLLSSAKLTATRKADRLVMGA